MNCVERYSITEAANLPPILSPPYTTNKSSEHRKLLSCSPRFWSGPRQKPAMPGSEPPIADTPQSLCEDPINTVIPSAARNLALSVSGAVRDSSSPAAPRNDMETEFSHRLLQGNELVAERIRRPHNPNQCCIVLPSIIVPVNEP